MSWSDPHLPGLAPDAGQRLDPRYARWLGACGKCRAPVITVENRNGRTYIVDAKPRDDGNLALTLHGGNRLLAHVPMPHKRADHVLYHRHTCTRKAPQ